MIAGEDMEMGGIGGEIFEKCRVFGGGGGEDAWFWSGIRFRGGRDVVVVVVGEVGGGFRVFFTFSIDGEKEVGREEFV